MGFMVERSRKDKGIPEGGRRGRLHNWKISHRSPDFKLFLKYLKIWQPSACRSPWQHQLVLSGRCPLQTGHALCTSPRAGRHPAHPPRSHHLARGHLSRANTDRKYLSRKPCPGHGDRGICRMSVQLGEFRVKSPPSVLMAVVQYGGWGSPNPQKSVLCARLGWWEGSKTRPRRR